MSSRAALPDELLLRIFMELPRRALRTAVRPVCRQWFRLAEDRTLWEGQGRTAFEIRCGLSDTELRDIVLDMRIAPRISLRLFLHYASAQRVRRNVLEYDWEGRIQAVQVRVGSLMGYTSIYSDLLRKLQHDVREFDVSGISGKKIMDLISFVNDAPHLKSLGVCVENVSCVLANVSARPRQLEALEFMGDLWGIPVSLVESMVSASRHSLRVFRLFGMEAMEGAEVIVHALGRCPLLEDVSMDVLDGVAALSACTALKRLDIFEAFILAEQVPQLDGFLRSLAGGNLRSLRITYHGGDQEQLLQAMKTLGQLTSLDVGGYCDDAVAMDLLRGLPRLEELRVELFPRSADAVMAIAEDPSLAPSLRLLHVLYSFNDSQPHPSLDLLCARRPLLRIDGHLHYEQRWARVTCSCSVCRT